MQRNLLTMNRRDSPLSSRNFRSREPMILYSIWLQQGQGTFSAHRIKNAFRGTFFYVIMRDDYHIFLEDVSRRATGNSRHYGRRLFLSPGLLKTLYPSIPGQTIPSTFGHYKTALTKNTGFNIPQSISLNYLQVHHKSNWYLNSFSS